MGRGTGKDGSEHPWNPQETARYQRTAPPHSMRKESKSRSAKCTDIDVSTIANCPAYADQPVSEKFGLIDVRSLSECERVPMVQRLDLE